MILSALARAAARAVLGCRPVIVTEPTPAEAPVPQAPPPALKPVEALPTDERGLIQLAQQGNRLAVAELVHRHQGLICKAAGEAPGDDFDEKLQLARLGFLEAIRQFKPSHSTKLTTYAWYKMKSELLPYRKNVRRELLTLDASVSDEDDTPLVEAMPAMARTPEELTMLKQEGNALLEALTYLEPVEQAAIARHLDDEPETLQAVGERFGMSKSYASRIEARARKQLAPALQG